MHDGLPARVPEREQEGYGMVVLGYISLFFYRIAIAVVEKVVSLETHAITPQEETSYANFPLCLSWSSKV